MQTYIPVIVEQQNVPEDGKAVLKDKGHKTGKERRI